MIKSAPQLRFKEFSGNWLKESFGTLAVFKNGLNFDNVSKGKGLKIVGVADFKDHFSISYDSLDTVNVDLKNKQEYLLDNGDILFVRSNGNKSLIGRALYIENLREEVSFSGFTIRARFNSTKTILPAFYAHYFRSNVPRQQFLLLGGGTNISNLNQEILGGLVLPTPSVKEQQKITSFLSSVDTKIQQLTKKKNLLEEYKKGVMQKIFKQEIRFKDQEGKSFPEWGNKKLNEYLYEAKTRNFDMSFDRQNVLSVSGEHGIVNQIEHLGRSYAGESVANYHVVQTGDIVYTKSPLKANPYGIIKVNKGKPGIVSTLYAVYRCKPNINGKFLDYYFQIVTNTNNYLKPLVHKGAKNDMKVNNAHVLTNVVKMPSLAEQEKIVAFFEGLDAKIKQVTIQLDKTKDFKKGLLQQMFV